MISEKISHYEYGFLKWIVPISFGGILGVIYAKYIAKPIIDYYPNEYLWFGLLGVLGIIWYFGTTLTMKRILKFIPSPDKQKSREFGK